MKFRFKQEGFKENVCDVEIFKNEDGIVAKFFNKEIESK